MAAQLTPTTLNSTDSMLVDELFDARLSVSPHKAQEVVSSTSMGQQTPEPELATAKMAEGGLGSHTPQASQLNNVTVSRNGKAKRTRRTHTKSRLGCLKCKQRKIKCQQQRPACAACIKLGCKCQYSPPPQAPKTPAPGGSYFGHCNNPQSVVYLPGTPGEFTAHDMRLFHHFIVSAHPFIPHEYEATWITAVPLRSHQYDYLMHAILAISSSHLAIYVDDPFNTTTTAFLHRQKAIAGLEAAFNHWPPRPDEAHVILATSYLLAFQSTYLPDGFLDHVLSLRGCSLISRLILQHQLQGAFTIDPNMSNKLIERKLRRGPKLDQGLARDGLHSLESLLPLLLAPEAQDIERAVWAQLVEILRALLVPLPPQCPPSPPETQLHTPDNGSHGSPMKNALDVAVLPSTQFSFMPPLTLSPAPSPSAAVAGTEVTDNTTHIKHPLDPANTPTGCFAEILGYFAEGDGSLVSVPASHRPDPQRSFNALMSSLLVLVTYPQDELIHLFDPSNKLGAVLLSHFLAVRSLIAPLMAPEKDNVRAAPIAAMVDWLAVIVRGLEQDDSIGGDEGQAWTMYVEWPRRILGVLEKLKAKKRGLGLGDLNESILRNPEQFREQGELLDTYADVGRFVDEWSLGMGRVSPTGNPL